MRTKTCSCGVLRLISTHDFPASHGIRKTLPRSDETIRYGRDGYLIRDSSDLHLEVGSGSSDGSFQIWRTNELRWVEHERSEEPEKGYPRRSEKASETLYKHPPSYSPLGCWNRSGRALETLSNHLSIHSDILFSAWRLDQV